ncbi:MAG: glycosyltransferase family 4 protein [Chloroflexi bacterium]|nr:glycosyltransferase family 4 protein [Chloroflexota bacterium]MBU1750368.1 glycosyltransferase family 4 protein [Chloroflexota bacterium]
MQRVRVVQCITRLIVGGAQEVAMLTAAGLDPARYECSMVSGPQTGPEGEIISEVRARGIPLIILPELVREISPAKDLLALVKLTRFMRRGRFHVVHTHSSKAGILGRVAARWAGVPVIVHTVHGWGFYPGQSAAVHALYVNLERLADRCGDRIIVVSRLNADKGLEAGISSPAQYVTIHGCIDVAAFAHPTKGRAAMRAELGLPADAPVVGTVGRLSPQKAPLDWVRAAAVVAQSVPTARFVYVGDGPLRPAVEALIAELGLTDRVILAGLRRDVPDLLAAFDVFALSSLWEGLPLVIPQAMAAGVPVVCTNVDGTAEAITEGVNGRLVPPGEPEALGAAIAGLLQDPAERRRLAVAGRQRAQDFDVPQMVAAVAGLYQELLAKKGILLSL